MVVLEARGLSLTYPTEDGPVAALSGIGLTIGRVSSSRGSDLGGGEHA